MSFRKTIMFVVLLLVADEDLSTTFVGRRSTMATYGRSFSEGGCRNYILP